MLRFLKWLFTTDKRVASPVFSEVLNRKGA